MKYIRKGSEPIEFTDWKQLENEDWKPSYDKLQSSEKRAVLNALINEQGGICCYCERELIDTDYHIEHLKPQHLSSVDPLDFSNMLCSCQKNLQKGEPLHCGNSKADWFDDELFITPLYNNCEKRFKFTYDGYIDTFDDNDLAAIETIKKLNLYIPKLIEMRKKAIEPFLDDTLDDTEFLKFVDDYLTLKSGKYNAFYTTIKFLFQ